MESKNALGEIEGSSWRARPVRNWGMTGEERLGIGEWFSREARKRERWVRKGTRCRGVSM